MATQPPEPSKTKREDAIIKLDFLDIDYLTVDKNYLSTVLYKLCEKAGHSDGQHMPDDQFRHGRAQ